MRIDLYSMALAAGLGLGGAACDPKVTAPRDAVPAPASGPLSTQGESCAATADCSQAQGTLRCVDVVCRSPQASRVGDFHWAAGHAAMAAGDAERASASFGRALGQYDTDKQAPPPALLCEAGAVLRKKKGDAKAGEQAARLLHRCVLATPPGSALYQGAMIELAALEDQGLEPTLLARGEPADAYLTRPAAKAPPGPAKLTIDQTVPHRDKGYAAFADALVQRASADLVKCAEGAGGAFDVPLSLKYRQTLGDDDVVVGAKLEVSGNGSGSSACVRDVAARVATDFARDLRVSSGSWQGTLTIKLAPG
jgi:hypothetical protein